MLTAGLARPGGWAAQGKRAFARDLACAGWVPGLLIRHAQEGGRLVECLTRLPRARRFSESMADALKGRIRVTTIFPAFVATEMTQCGASLQLACCHKHGPYSKHFCKTVHWGTTWCPFTLSDQVNALHDQAAACMAIHVECSLSFAVHAHTCYASSEDRQ